MNSKIKSLIAILMAAVLVLSLASCSVTDKLKSFFSEEEVITEPYTSKTEKPTQVADVVNYFNEISNKVKQSKVALEATYTYDVGDFECENEYVKAALPTVKDYVLKNYLEENETVSVEYGGDIKNIYPIAGEDWSSKLTAADVETAVCAQASDDYKIIIRLADDYTPEVGSGVGSAFSFSNKEEILGELSKMDEYLKVNDYSVKYSNCSIDCVADRATDEISSATYSCKAIVTASVTGVGTMASVGTTEITMSITKTVTYKLDWVDPSTTTTEA